MPSLHPCRNLIVASISLLGLLGCDQDNPTSLPEPPVVLTNPVQIKSGDTWLYRRMFINQGLRKAAGVPGTLLPWGWYR